VRVEKEDYGKIDFYPIKDKKEGGDL